jgi:ubiquinone biosynthesis protein UbiJ
MMEANNPDPAGWVHIFAGGVLAAAAKWAWDKLTSTKRPARTEHSSAFLLAEVRQIKDAVDGVAGTVQGLEDRVMRLEQRPRPRPASTSTD